MNDIFRKFSHKISEATGTFWAFFIACGVIIIWIFTGPVFNFSDTWQLVINTGTTIVTFLMVFLIQNTQNRDARAIHLKIDSLIKATRGASNQMLELENMSDEELDILQDEYDAIYMKYEAEKKRRENRGAKKVNF